MELIIICTVKYLEIVNKYMYVYIYMVTVRDIWLLHVRYIWLLYVTYSYCTCHIVTVCDILLL